MPIEDATRPPAASPPARASGGPEFEAFLNVVLTSARLIEEVTELVKTQGLTEPQFNALRILRGAGVEGLPCSAIARRMISRVPDITRLVDRLERMGVAKRHRDEETDRRVVRVTISPLGLELLLKLDAPVRELHRRQFDHLSPAEVRELTRLLNKVRTR